MKYKVIPEVADAIAASLRRFGYPDVTSETVSRELAAEPGDRSIVGMMAASICADNGLPPEVEGEA